MLTRASVRLARDAPDLAALLRLVLLDYPPAELVVATLELAGGGPLSAEQLARLTLRQDDG